MANFAKIITKDTVCRLCFGICNDLREVFDTTNKYAERISKFLYLQLQKNDDLSTKICWSCANYLDMFQQFYKKIIDTQKHHLSTKFEQYQLEPIFIVKNIDCGSKKDEVQIAYKVQDGKVVELVSPKTHEKVSGEPEKGLNKSKTKDNRTLSPILPVRKTRFSINKGESFKDNTVSSEIVVTTYKRKIKKEKIPMNAENIAESEPEPFNDICSEEEYKPPTPKKRVHQSDRTKKRFMKVKEEPSKSLKTTKQNDYSIIAVDDPNASINNVTFCEEWPLSENYEKFPNKILENGCLLIRGKELNDLVSKFYKLQCEICSENNRFTDIRHMYQHYKQHKISGFVRCCGIKIERYRCAVLHMSRHIQPEAFKCKICSYIVTRPKFLEVHMKTHLPENEKPFACPHCSKRFCWKPAYIVHLETHKSSEERKTYMCHICPKVYDTPGGLSTHKKLVHSQYKAEKHFCHVCAKAFATKTGLNEHMNTIHQRDKTTVQCNECGSWLMNKRCLKTHMLLHSNIDHKCSECDYTTKKPYLLTRHIITHHSTEKPFECDKCQKKFKLKRALTVHIQQAHTDNKVKSYKCSFCDKTFGSSTNFYTHRKNLHPVELAALKQKQEEEKRRKRIEAGIEGGFTESVTLQGGEGVIDLHAIEESGQMILFQINEEN